MKDNDTYLPLDEFFDSFNIDQKYPSFIKMIAKLKTMSSYTAMLKEISIREIQAPEEHKSSFKELYKALVERANKTTELPKNKFVDYLQSLASSSFSLPEFELSPQSIKTGKLDFYEMYHVYNHITMYEYKKNLAIDLLDYYKINRNDFAINYYLTHASEETITDGAISKVYHHHNIDSYLRHDNLLSSILNDIRKYKLENYI